METSIAVYIKQRDMIIGLELHQLYRDKGGHVVLPYID